MRNEEVFAEASHRLGLPYALDSFYLPLVRPADAGALSDKPFIDPKRLINLETVQAFAAEIGKHFRPDLPTHDTAKALGLGLGYGSPDCNIYQQVVSAYQPEIIIEIGAGVSTFFARQGSPNCKIICIEPYPAEGFPGWCAENKVELWRAPLQAVAHKLSFHFPPYAKPQRTILFVDSTHVAKINSELHTVFIDVLPCLPAGSLIHFHDIFLPYPCLHGGHNSFAQTANWYESILLGVFLSASSSYETVFPQYFLGRDWKTQSILEQAVPSYANGRPEGSAYWIRKR